MKNVQSQFLNIAKARQHSQDLMNKINRLAGSGNVEDQKQAVGLGAELTRSLFNEKHAVDAYMAAVSASLLANLNGPGTMSRDDYQKLSPGQRLAFAKSGGKLRT